MLSIQTAAPPALRSDTGTLPDDHPYASVGDGSRALVVLPGVGDSMFPGTYPPFTGWAIAPYFARYLREHTVYVLSRPRGLPAGYDAADAVESHARALEAIADSHVGIDVLGVSMGGQIGQALAAQQPELVDRLVLANSAHRIGDGARETVREFQVAARNRDWASIRSGLATAMFTDGRAVAYPLFLRTVGRPLQPRPADPSDVRRSLQFVLEFDGRDLLSTVEPPVLLVGGDRDPVFPPERTRATVERLPNGDLELIPGAKHGAFHERKATFDSRVQEFLEATDPS
ncbi:alpha/beta fold hydrolase [Halopiger aswanensis]|uniref:Pimeloyl-ACP methyl ester carboxylesterase n=1 Tax=Halopiger aswanensis TaxID=148449 RepID=A0A3R7FXP1_9EURY|nr:alpha/beta hydrolase [Halopiger aswanensis]RKD97592.1 pimeloyl-ACP methyl ester carboxylesterase [Halopiger aswanensis]